MICPTHDTIMHEQPTEYGIRYSCRISGYTMVGWEHGADIPADKPTRDARMAAHEAFDHLWTSRQVIRRDAYKRLSASLRLKPELTHISLFDVAMCERVIEFAEKLPRILLLEKYK